MQRELVDEALAVYRVDKALRVHVVKDDRRLAEDLLELLTRYGLRQIDETGRLTYSSLGGGRWVIPPSLVDGLLAEKTVLVQRIAAETRSSVRESLRRLMDTALHESPAPSVGEIARRIRTQFHGATGGEARGGLVDVTEPGILPTETQGYGARSNLYAFSSERAALIARTEAQQYESTGIFAGMDEAGVEEIEWLSSNNPNHGDRRHDLMNGKTVRLGEYFVTPLGNRMRYPGDPEAPIKETANCGCSFAPARRRAG